MSSVTWYPLRLSTHVRSYAFGDRAIPDRLGKVDLPQGRIAETWEYSDYRDTSGSVLNGELRGATLRNLTRSYPEELVGPNWRGPHFPLLGKFLDASHALPVHLHADDETALERYGEPNGKTEAWHILWAKPGATVLAGVRPETTKDVLRTAFLQRNYDAVMRRLPVESGDTLYIPGGVLHSFGPDTLVFEIQQTSDLSQSVSPHDVYGVELTTMVWKANIEKTLEELKAGYQPKPSSGLTIASRGGERRICVASRYFALERWQFEDPFAWNRQAGGFVALTNLGAPVVIESENRDVRLPRATSCIVPSALGPIRLKPTDDAGDVIASYVPNLAAEIVTPLIEAGHSINAIRDLGDVMA